MGDWTDRLMERLLSENDPESKDEMTGSDAVLQNGFPTAVSQPDE